VINFNLMVNYLIINIKVGIIRSKMANRQMGAPMYVEYVIIMEN